MLSFARSNLMDDGCVIICSTIKHLSHIEKINFSHCDLSEPSAIHISDLIKFQTINRYSEEWMRSFRYQDLSGNAAPPGLKCLVLNGNIDIGDKGLQRIVMNLKNDEWIKGINSWYSSNMHVFYLMGGDRYTANNFILFLTKAVEFQNCGLTDAGGLSIIDCLKYNKTIAVLDINYNPKISKRVFNEIQKMLGAEPDVFGADRKGSTMKLR